VSAVSASLVKELRDQTGAGMMDCKRALEESEGDLEAARRLLRERGMASAAKRADRSTPEGLVGYIPDGTVWAMVAVGCETEPVSKNAEFQAFAEKTLRAVKADGPGAVEALETERQELVAKLGENIRVVGATRMEAGPGEDITAYVHPPANKIGSMLRFKGDPALARELALHLAFAKPRYLTRAEVPETEVQAEREVQLASEEVLSKPETVREKIVEGKLQKWFADSVLLEQEWFRGGGTTVKQELGDMEVLEFTVYALAG
jgi:elongation factor Ts